MNNSVVVADLLEGHFGTLVDVRSPSEFQESSIPGAINLPLFDDQERALIGTVHRHRGEEEARRLGIQLLGPRLAVYLESFRSLPNKPVVFCWRGGMRSQSVCQLLTMAGIPSQRLLGGYKAYRRHINGFFEKEPSLPLIVLDGLTGVGKTEVIEALKTRGLAAIDLEGLAKNRGSVFGALGMKKPPSQKDFEGALAQEMMAGKQAGCFVVECESRRIGRLTLPRTFAEAMEKGEHILLYASEESRINRLTRIYGVSSPYALRKPLEMLVGRLGRERINDLLDKLFRGELRELTAVLLKEYYDPLYRFPSEPSKAYEMSVSTDNIDQAATTIAQYIRRKYTDHT